LKLYKYRSIKNLEFLLDIILLERLYCAPYTELNDPCEGMFSYSHPYMPLPPIPGIGPLHLTVPGMKFITIKTIKDLPRVASLPRICSLSNTLSDVRLWSYYADGHKGVAIEIDFTEFEDDVREIRYCKKLEEHEVGTLLTGCSNPIDILSSKTFHWEYEKEYRIVQEQEKYGIAGRITGIYIGIKGNESYELLKKVVPRNIPLINTRLNPVTLTIEATL
jgi:hypothetical protein